jgi:glycosyltransferase involved in cell wall biosynthesis
MCIPRDGNDNMSYTTLSIIIPVYNEEKFVEKTIEAVTAADSLGLSKEIIMINDGSTDNSAEVLEKLEKKYKKDKIVIIDKKKNEGKGAALRDGLMKSTGDIVLIQDADLEYSPEDYPLLLEPMVRNEADVVYGSRFISHRPHRVMYFWHYVVNMFLTTFSNMLTNLNLTDMETGYKVFKGDIIRAIAPKLETKRFGFEPEVTARLSKIPAVKIYEVGISYAGRTYEEGKKIGWRDGVRALWEIIKYNLFVK